MKPAKVMPPEGRTAGLWEQPQPFVLPHSVEMAFVRSMECPFCHSNLLMDRPAPKTPETIYCPVCGWKPRDVKKIARSKTVYHVAPRGARQSILEHGIDQSRSPRGGDLEGNWLWPDLESAHFYSGGDPDFPMDIWEVNVNDLPLQNYDEQDFEGYPGLVTFEAIPKERVRFLKEAHGSSDDFRTLVGMMKNALNNENYKELYQLAHETIYLRR
jgi:hypothetical protein